MKNLTRGVKVVNVLLDDTIVSADIDFGSSPIELMEGGDLIGHKIFEKNGGYRRTMEPSDHRPGKSRSEF